MRLHRRSILDMVPIGFLLTSLGVAPPSPAYAQNIAQPAGWIKTESNGASIFRPNGVPSGKLYFIIIFPEESLGDKSLTQWFNQHIDMMLAKSGTLIQRGKVEHKTPKVLTCTSAFKPTLGEPCVGVFKAAAPRPGYGRLMMMTSVSDPTLKARYKTASRAIIRDFIAAATSEPKEPGENTSTGASGDASKDKGLAPPAEKEPPAGKKDGSAAAKG